MVSSGFFCECKQGNVKLFDGRFRTCFTLKLLIDVKFQRNWKCNGLAFGEEADFEAQNFI